MADLAAGTIKSTTIEGAFLELAQLLNAAEQAVTPGAGQQPPNRLQLNINTDTKVATVNATLPLALTVNATTGALVIAAEEYC